MKYKVSSTQSGASPAWIGACRRELICLFLLLCFSSCCCAFFSSWQDLHFAVMQDDLDRVKSLIAQGAYVDIRAYDGVSDTMLLKVDYYNTAWCEFELTSFLGTREIKRIFWANCLFFFWISKANSFATNVFVFKTFFTQRSQGVVPTERGHTDITRKNNQVTKWDCTTEGWHYS